MAEIKTADFVEELKSSVQTHPVLTHPWLEDKKSHIDLDSMLLWLSQEYHVSVSFVNWFLYTAAQTDDQYAKIVLVENIWEELGEGDLSQTHVSILDKFLENLNYNTEKRIFLPHTKNYLDYMLSIVQKSFFHGIGALGPANEYLLKLEYSIMRNLYLTLQKNHDLPTPVFFQVNLSADEGHSKRLFDLIESTANTQEKRIAVEEGNRLALDARLIFYDGLMGYS
ncbi:MAG: iron-containing redox enzyme family protein [Leptospira sp.]|nr:iron-containing redox enzyme family protein [Leptospira sp.]